MLHVVWHGTESLVYSNLPREAAASSSLYTGRIANGIPQVLRSSADLMQLPHH